MLKSLDQVKVSEVREAIIKSAEMIEDLKETAK
jgi:hypothetical protein